MFTSNKPYLHMSLALSGLLIAQSSLAEERVEDGPPSSVVNIYRPENPCELIEAIINANADGESSIVDLGNHDFELDDDCFDAASNCPGILPEACFADGLDYSHGPNGLPEITSNLSIVNGRIFRGINDVGSFRIFTVLDGGLLSLFKVSLENGNAQPFEPEPPIFNLNKLVADSGNGGAVFVDDGAILHLLTSKLDSNLANDSGGGVYVAAGGQLSAVNSLIINNSANAQLDNEGNNNPDGGGGGIYLDGPTNGTPGAVLLGLTNSSVSDNTTDGGLGGGLYNQGRAQNIFNTTFSFNTTCEPAPGSGECEVGANPAGAGGAIYNDEDASFLEVTQSTFWGNRAYTGGGIYNEENDPTTVPPPAIAVGVYLNNNTIANNFSSLFGGGIFNSNSTGDQAQPGAIINQFVSNIVAHNTDFANNIAPDIYTIAQAALV